jgi:hypothetical protein
VKILVAGSRTWANRDSIYRVLSALGPGTEIIHGGNGYYRIIDGQRRAVRGADAIAGEVAKQLGFVVHEHPADWVRYGKSAGPKRNGLMLLTHHIFRNPIDHAYLFHEDIGASKGTADMMNRLKKAEISYTLITGKPDRPAVGLAP